MLCIHDSAGRMPDRGSAGTDFQRRQCKLPKLVRSCFGIKTNKNIPIPKIIMDTKKIALIILVLVFVGIISLILFAQAPNYPQKEAPRPFLGKEDSTIIVQEFSDFECPTCITVTPYINEIIAQYKDKIRFEYRNYPLPIHQNSELAAIAGECANDFNKFWEFHDKIFEEQQALNPTGTVQYGVPELKTWAGEIGLNTSSFNSCLDSGKYKEEVAKDTADGIEAGVTGTPSFFINGILIVGAQPFSAFQAAIEAEL